MMRGSATSRADRCSFCGKRRNDTDYLVAGPRGVAICSECAAVAHQVAAEAIVPGGGDLLLTGISRLVTNDPKRDGLLGDVRDAAVAIRHGKVTWVGEERALPGRYRELPSLGCEGRAATPGFVDGLTRLVGSRWETRPDPDHLVATTVEHAGQMLQHGITALDIHAGGTLDPTTDTVLLAAARAVGERLPITVSVTWVCASHLGKRVLREVMAPTAARLASAAELTCRGEPDIPDRQMLAPLPARIHLCDREAHGCRAEAAGALTVTGPGLGGEPVPGAVSLIVPLDHLRRGSFPGRRLWDAGEPVAIATGSDPDGTVLAGMGLPVALATESGGLSPAETVWSITRGGALGMGAPERGRLRAGSPADVVVLDSDELTILGARPDANPCWRVVVSGSIVPM